MGHFVIHIPVCRWRCYELESGIRHFTLCYHVYDP